MADARGTTPLWRNLNFVLMWSSVAASGFGDRLIQLASWALLGMEDQSIEASSIQAGVYFFFFLPYLLFSPLGGWLADTLPRKWIMLACDEGRGLLLLWAMVLVPAGAAVVLPAGHHWKVYGLIFAVGVLAAVFSPTRNATIPQIVPTRHLQSANAIVLGIAVIASMIGLFVGSRIIKNWSVQGGLLVGVLLYMVSGTFFAFLRIRRQPPVAPERRSGQVERLKQAFVYIRTHRPVLELVLVNMLFWSAAHVLLAAIAGLCKSDRHYAIEADQLLARITDMQGLVGLGMLASSLWVAWLNTRRESNWLAMASLLLAGVCMLLMGLIPSYAIGLGLAVLAGFFGNTAMICVATLTQSLTPNYVRGRVFGARELLSTALAVAINFVVWRLPNADRWIVPVMYGCAALLGAVALRSLWRQLTRGPHAQRAVNFCWRIDRAYTLIWHRLRWIGRHHVPASGPLIVAANHTTALDPFLIQATIPRLVRWLMLTKHRFRLAAPLWRAIRPITLDRDQGDVAQIRRVLRALAAGEVVGIFPEGGLQRTHRALQPLHAGIGLMARRSRAPIVPVWIHGTPRVGSMLWQLLRPSRCTVTIGRPYQPDVTARPEAIAEDLRRRLLDLAAAHAP